MEIKASTLKWALNYGGFESATQLIQKGISVLQLFPDFLHHKLYLFYENTFYGAETDIDDILESDDFIESSQFVRKYGYPINVMLPRNSDFGSYSGGELHVGKTELDLAIIYGHRDAVLYLRMTGGRRRKELLHPMGSFTFLDTDEDKLLLKVLILYEQEKLESAFNIIRTATDLSLSKLALISIINSYTELQNLIMEISPSEFDACSKVLLEHDASLQAHASEEKYLADVFFKIAEEWNIELFKLVFGLLKHAESKQSLIQTCINPDQINQASIWREVADGEQDTNILNNLKKTLNLKKVETLFISRCSNPAF